MSEVKPHNTITNPVVLYNPKYAEIGQDILSLPWKDSGYYPHFVETNPTASATAEALNDAIEKIGVDTKQIGIFVCGGEGTVRLAGLAMRETVLRACTETVGIGWIGGGYASDFGKAHSGNKRLPPIEIVQKSQLRKGRSLVRSTVTLDGTKKNDEGFMYMGFGLTGAGARHTNIDTWPDIIPGLKQLRVLAGSFRDNQPVRIVNQKRSFSDISFCINPWMSMHLQTGATQFDAQFRVISLPCERRKMIRPLWNLLTGREVGEREDAFRFVTYTPVLGHVDGENPEEFSPGTRISIEWGAPILLLTHMSSPPQSL